jgi:hypothetical protein
MCAAPRERSVFLGLLPWPERVQVGRALRTETVGGLVLLAAGDAEPPVLRGRAPHIALARPVLAMDSYVSTLTPDGTEDYGEMHPLSQILRVLPAGDSRKNTDGEGHGHG